MPVKVNNIRLELDDPEECLPQRAVERLGVGRDAISHWRILRKSLDARRHDEIHFLYAAEVELPGDEAALAGRSLGRGIQAYTPELFDWPEPGREPLSHRPLILGAGPAGLF